jgi:hypothetical protein
MRGILSLILVVLIFAVTVPPTYAVAEEKPEAAAAPASEDAKCEHGVSQQLCPRCNPKLEAVYKAKGDWCAEHSRPESQCVVCHPELAKKGIK